MTTSPIPARVIMRHPIAGFEHCRCSTCTLFNAKLMRPVGGEGSLDARIILVGEAPGRNEVIYGRPFVGESGKLLDAMLAAVGLLRSEVYMTNAVLCRGESDALPTAGELASCNARLQAELQMLAQRRIIVVLGGSAIKAVTGVAASVGAMQGRVEWHAELDAFVLYTWHPAAVLRDPDHYPDVLYVLRRAREMLEQDIPQGPLSPATVRWRYVDTEPEALWRLSYLLAHHTGSLVCDIETTGLDWMHDSITQVGLYAPGKIPLLLGKPIIYRDRVQKALAALFHSPLIHWMYHNAKFDTQFLAHHILAETLPPIHEDTMLLHYALDERGGGKSDAGSSDSGGTTHSLKPLAYKFCNAPVWDEGIKEAKKAAKAAGNAVDIGALYANPKYHAHDVYYTAELQKELLREHAAEPPSAYGYPSPLAAYQQVMIPVINAVAAIEMRGVRVDAKEMERLERYYNGDAEQEGELARLERECQFLAGIIFPKRTTTWETYTKVETKGRGSRKIVVGERQARRNRQTTIVQEPLNIRSTAQIRFFLYDHLHLEKRYAEHSVSGEPTTNEETLTFYAHCHPFIVALLRYREQHKLYSTYVAGVNRHIDEYGAVRTHFSLHRTVTGRPSSLGPNLQNIPKVMKSPFIARPGYTLIEADYSNQEVRMGALLSRDAQMLADIQVADFHWEVTKDVFHVIVGELEQAQGSLAQLEALLTRRSMFRLVEAAHEQHPSTTTGLYNAMRDHVRKAAKAVTFGVMYCEGGQGLANTLHIKSGIDISVAEGTMYIENWLKKYQGFASWAERRKQDVIDYGFVDTPTGRRRRFYLLTEKTLPSAQRQAVNMPIQSTASDMTMLSVAKLHHLLTERTLGYVLFFVHDSIICEVPMGKEREAALLIKEVMEHIIYDMLPAAPVFFPVDLKKGTRWSDVEPYLP